MELKEKAQNMEMPLSGKLSKNKALPKVIKHSLTDYYDLVKTK